MMIFLVLGIVCLIILSIGVYNKYVRLKNLNQEGWSGIETYLQKRWDLIPNLVNTVKGYATHERETLENVIKMRSEVMSIDTKDIQNIEKVKKIENELSKTLRSIMMLQESYPDLKANTNFQALQQELTETESKIAAARQFYNDTVLSLNNKVELFPSNLVAKIFGFKKEAFFEAETEAKVAPKVQF